MPDLLHCARCGREWARGPLCPGCMARLRRDNPAGVIGTPPPALWMPCRCGHGIRAHFHPRLHGVRTHCSRGTCGCREYRPAPASTRECDVLCVEREGGK
jgi:hypothetical protein